MNPPNRFLSIDLFKTLGIIYLIILHEVVWFFTYGDGLGLRYEEVWTSGKLFGYQSGLHVLGFQIPLLAGITYYLSLQRKALTFGYVCQRALILALLGYLMNFLAWGWENIFDWDVLPFIGLSWIVSYPLIKRHSSLKWIILFLAGLVVLSLSNHFPSLTNQGDYFLKVILGDREGESYWPFCPWFFIFVVGLFMGKFYFEAQKPLVWFLIIGVLFLCLSVLSGHFLPFIRPDHIWGAELFKPSPFFVLGIAGFSLVAIPLAEYFLSKKKWSGHAFLFLGRQILWVYLFSTVFGYQLTALAVSNFDLNFPQAVVMFFVLLITNVSCSYFLAKTISQKRMPL
jgi:hypothetical protein